MKIKIGLLFIALMAFPFLIGVLCNKIIQRKAKTVMVAWVNGFICCLGSFQLFVLPAILFSASLTVLSVLYSIFILVISIYSLFINQEEIKTLLERAKESIKKTPWQSWVAMCLILFQMGMYFFYVHIDDDDAFYVATAVAAVDTNTVYEYNPYTGEIYEGLPMRYVLSPFSIFTSVLSCIFGIHATILSHTVLPVIYLGLAYAVYILLGHELFKGRRKDTAVYIIWIALISMFLNSTVYTHESFMLFRIWQGKAFLAAVLLPMIFYLGYRNIRNRNSKYEWIVLFFTLLASTLVSSMGIMLGAIMTGIMGILAYLIKRDVKNLLQYAFCCVPNIVLALVYLIYR